MMKDLKRLGLVAAILVLPTVPASANSITSWSCEIANGVKTLTLSTSQEVSSGAVININGTAESGAVTVNGTQVSLAIDNGVPCWNRTFTITDGGDTFGLE
ncbi:MAG: hypothetical protein ACON31_05295 [Candidatus Puniceispirillaceae bacterium]